MTGLPAIIIGALLCVFALYASFVAGSDHARIRGYSKPLLSGALALSVGALMLEYHA